MDECEPLIAGFYEFTTFLGGLGVATNIVTNFRDVAAAGFVPVTVTPGPRYVPNCFASGAGIEAGTSDPIVNVASALFVQEADQFGNKRSDFTLTGVQGQEDDRVVSIFEISFTKVSSPQADRTWVHAYTNSATAKQAGASTPPLLTST